MSSQSFRLLLVATALALAVPAEAAQHEQVSTHRIPAKAGTRIDLENLAGAVLIEAGSGREVVVEAKVVAGARSEDEARRLAGLIRLAPETRGDTVVLHTGYPLDESREYKYERSGRWSWGSSTTTRYQGERVRISSHGLDLHVDFKVQVPKGVTVRFRNVVGDMEVARVDGELDLDTGSGAIAASDTRGRLKVDTGSGSVRIEGHEGEVDADTGSGRIEITRLTGELRADTGSGGIEVTASKGRVFDLDTGSGRISIEDSQVERFSADTGSGGVSARGLDGVRELKADAGSGSVRLEGDFSTTREIDIDTGSGGVTLVTSKPLNLRLEVEAGSGGIDVDLDNLNNVRSSRGDFTGTAGKGEGRARISTGSGGTRIRQR